MIQLAPTNQVRVRANEIKGHVYGTNLHETVFEFGWNLAVRCSLLSHFQNCFHFSDSSISSKVIRNLSFQILANFIIEKLQHFEIFIAHLSRGQFMGQCLKSLKRNEILVMGAFDDQVFKYDIRFHTTANDATSSAA